MREQFWGVLWGWSVGLLGANHRLSRALETRWSTAYWAAQPAMPVCTCPRCQALCGSSDE